MKVTLEISGDSFNATLRLPRSVVYAAVLAIGSFLLHVGYTYLQLQSVKTDLAECKAQIAAYAAHQGAD